MRIAVGLSVVALLISSSVAFAEGDPAKGKKEFKKCKACHDVSVDKKNKVGPHLVGIVGRAAGIIEDYKYSKAMIAKAEEGLVWDEETLALYLTKPKKFIKGTKMSFAGIKKEEKLSNLIAYLKTVEDVVAE